MANPQLRLAVVGVGSFGQLHACTAAGLVEIELTALVDPNVDRAREIARECGAAAVFATLEELIEAGCADAVVIATRTQTHLPLARTALLAGLHVLIEKPVGANVSEVAEFEQLCRAERPVAMAGHICLFHSLVGPLIKRVLRQGMRAAHFVRHRPVTLARDFPEEHPIAMTMVHDLYVLAALVEHDEPVYFDALCTAGVARAAGPVETDDMTWATLQWADGRVATLQSHWTLPPGSPVDGWDSTEIFGAGYHARIATNPQNFQWNDSTATWPQALEISSVDSRPTGMLAEELRAFAAACRTGQVHAGCRIVDALQVQSWTEQLMRSARAKKPA